MMHWSQWFMHGDSKQPQKLDNSSSLPNNMCFFFVVVSHTPCKSFFLPMDINFWLVANPGTASVVVFFNSLEQNEAWGPASRKGKSFGRYKSSALLAVKRFAYQDQGGSSRQAEPRAVVKAQWKPSYCGQLNIKVMGSRKGPK